MSRVICRNCGDDLSYVADGWIPLRLPIARAWTHAADPVEAGSGDDTGSAGAAVPARPHPPTLSGAAAVPLTFEGDDAPADSMGG